MPEAEKRKLVAELTASEINCQNQQVADLKFFSKHIYNAYLKIFNMTKKKARGILTGKASSTPVSALVPEGKKEPATFPLFAIQTVAGQELSKQTSTYPSLISSFFSLITGSRLGCMTWITSPERENKLHSQILYLWCFTDSQ